MPSGRSCKRERSAAVKGSEQPTPEETARAEELVAKLRYGSFAQRLRAAWDVYVFIWGRKGSK